MPQTRTGSRLAAAAVLCLFGCASYTPIRTHFNKGVRFYDEKNYAGAAREYRLAIEDDPKDLRAHFNLAMTLEEMGKPDLARAEYEWILAMNPDDLRASINLSAMEIDSGDREGGYARLQRMVDAYPTLALPKVALATQQLREGRLDEAEALARAALAVDESDIEANFILGEVLAKRGDVDSLAAARKSYLVALANAPDDVASLLALGRLERAQGKPDLARGYFRRVILQRRRSEEARRALAELSEEAGDLEDAVNQLWELRAMGGAAAEGVGPRLAKLYGELMRREEERMAVTSRPE